MVTHTEGFLRRSRTQLECYDDRKLINHGSIKLGLQHYSDESFLDHSFYVVETKTHKEINSWTCSQFKARSCSSFMQKCF